MLSSLSNLCTQNNFSLYLLQWKKKKKIIKRDTHDYTFVSNDIENLEFIIFALFYALALIRGPSYNPSFFYSFSFFLKNKKENRKEILQIKDLGLLFCNSS